MVSKLSVSNDSSLIYQEHIIPESIYSKIIQKINRLNKKLAGANRRQIEITDIYKHDTFNNVNGKLAVSDDISFKILFERPNENGWELVASLDFIEGENIFHLLNTKTIPKELELYKHSCACDHCQHNRKRIKTYIIKNKITGEIKQIGKSCFGNFVGVDAMLFDLIASLDIDKLIKDTIAKNPNPTKRELPNSVNIETFIAQTIQRINKSGYKKATDQNPTGKSVWEDLLGGLTKGEYNQLECNREEARKIIAWAKSKKGSSNTYLHNIYVLAETTVVRKIHSNLASSMVKAYYTETNKYHGKSNESNNNTNGETRQWKLKHRGSDYNFEEFLGAKGTPFTSFVKVESAYDYMGAYGHTFSYSFRDEYGEIIKWITTKNMNFEIGKEMNISGNVKGYRQEKTNVAFVNYVKVIPS